MDDQTKFKHLTLDDRIEIQTCLDKGMTFKSIAKRIGKDQTTVSKEVKKHISTTTNNYTDENLGPCPLLLKAPFVCNGCRKRHYSSCRFVKHLYQAKTAERDYRTLLSDARSGIALEREEFYRTEKIVSDAIEKGQHLNHIIASNDLPYSRSSIYRHINRSYYNVNRLDLPRAVKFKSRKKTKPEFVPKIVKAGRSYEDFQVYMEQNPDQSPVEADTVVGEGHKVIMTFHFNVCEFMFGLLLDNKTAAEAGFRVQSLKKRMLDAGFSFGTYIPVILTDNGGEFAHVLDFELDPDGNRETSVFYCHPYHSWEKPHVEKNHTILRDICPKGTSFDGLTQDDVNLIFSHMNAVKRDSLGGKSPYDLFSFLFSENLAAVFGISYIAPDEVIQSPQLLKKQK